MKATLKALKKEKSLQGQGKCPFHLKTSSTQNKVFTECCHCVLLRYYVPVSDSFLFLQAFVTVVLAVIPIQKEERERAHDQEEEDPDSEASIVFDRLMRQRYEIFSECFFFINQNQMQIFYPEYHTSRMSSLPSLTFSVAPTTSSWILSISLSCNRKRNKQALYIYYLSNKKYEQVRKKLTCCKTFSAKISWSREISTTFPSICLVSVKMKHKYCSSHVCLFIFMPNILYLPNSL